MGGVSGSGLADRPPGILAGRALLMGAFRIARQESWLVSVICYVGVSEFPPGILAERDLLLQ